MLKRCLNSLIVKPSQEQYLCVQDPLTYGLTVSVEWRCESGLSLERHVRATGNPVDHSVWVDGVRSMHRLFSAKKSATTVNLISAESGNPKRLWRVLNATLAA